MKPELLIKKLPHFGDLPLPAYETELAAGMDIRAALPADIAIAPGMRQLVPTGLQMAIPVGYEAQIRPRSGLAIRHGITMLNSPGTIDADYRGEVKVIVINHGLEDFIIRHGDRIAQMVVTPVTQVRALNVDVLPDSTRGHGGFGSTGVE
ncbi:MAG: dUTP diphosphatase [Cyclonatronaceae bacterium]